MFEIGFTELIVIGVVALIVIGPERLPKVARTAGHLYGRLQRYVSSVKTDISQEMRLDEMRRAGEEFKQSIESAAADVGQQATVVDDYLRNELESVNQAVADASRKVSESAVLEAAPADAPAQQSLPLDLPDQNPRPPAPVAVIETAQGDHAGKPA
ncbi:Sec-independent protein translocase protein TatB [Thiobacillus sp.]|uniref:Sec-independent protein translocase protein TatB n=1 Tax=Thiobacillus sp. TaxID=924 RepID=UPI0025D4AEE5|nr:Sec-independent protein translocase protein TatB [Thiobacillus sp.]MBT9539988.1 twin-arginine translocase subunit TatB [Thiobacillus sp.]